MDRHRRYYAEWKKSDKDKYYMISLIYGNMEYKKQNRETNKK